MNVRFFAGSKAQYLNIEKHNPIALYFCADTRELFWGDKLLSDGIRVVSTKDDLPSLTAAADGIIYYVVESRNGYVLSQDRTSWVQVIYAPATSVSTVPESEVDNTAVSVAAIREIENTIYEKIASIENLNKIETISFAGVALDRVNGVFSIERDAARKALGISFTEGQSERDIEIVATKEYVDTQIASIPEVDLSNYAKKADLIGFATEESVKKAIAEAELNDKDVDLSAYYTKSEVEALIPDTSNFATKAEIPSVEGFATEEFVTEAINNIEIPEADLSGLATKKDVENLASIQYVDEKVSTIDVPTKISELENDSGYLTEHQSLAEYAKSAIVVKHKYEVLPVDGLLVSYRENEVRLNTQRVVPEHQEVGAGGNSNMYYVTFRAYAPEGATGVIESDGSQTDKEPTALSKDTYGRSYATIWSAIANYNGNVWTKWGDSSTVNKYLGFYYTFKWYKEDELIGTDKVRVILTNDACHDDLVPDAIARRIDEKVAAVEVPSIDGFATKTELEEAIANIEHPTIDFTGYATEAYVDGKVAEIVIPDTSKFITEIPDEYVTETELTSKGFITEHQDISHLATRAEIPDVSNFITEEEVDAKGFLTEHQSLEGYAKTEDIPDVSKFITSIPEEYITESELAEELAKIEHPTVSLDGYATEAWVNGQGFIKEIPDTYAKKEELFSGSYTDLTDKPEIPSVEGLATTEYVDNAIAGIEIPEPEKVDLTGYAKLTDIPDVSRFITEIPAEFVTENELAAKGYLTEHQDISGKADKDHVHSYNELTDRPEIPSVAGLATEQFVQDEIAKIDIPEVDTSNLVSTAAFNEALAAKADSKPFTTSKLVGKAVGGFSIGDDVINMTVAEILAKLLGLSDGTVNPDEPESLLDYLINNRIPMYSQNAQGVLVTNPFELTTWDKDAANVQMNGVSTFYTITDDTGAITEAGYQTATTYNEEAWLTIALPDKIESFKVMMYDSMRTGWYEVKFEFEKATEQTIDGYIIWTVPEKYEIMSGSTYRFVIT